MPTEITKLLVRRGTNDQRLNANGTGITFSLGEPAFAYDVSRLYIGDGTTKGGVPVGMRNLGTVNSLFGTYAETGLSQEAYERFVLSAAEVGDIIYDKTTRLVYSLSARNTWPPKASDISKLDVTVLLNSSQLEFNAGNQLQIKNEGVGPSQIAASIAGDGLQKISTAAPISIQPNGIRNNMLTFVPGNTIKCNYETYSTNPMDMRCGPKQVIGRTSSSNLTAVDFSVILSEASITGLNGINVYSPAAGVTIFSLSGEVIRINESSDNGPETVNIVLPTTLNSTLSVASNAIFSGSIAANGQISTNGFPITTRQGITTNFGNLSCGRLLTRDIITQNNPIYAGTASIYCNGVFAGSADVSTTGDVVVNDVRASGDALISGNIYGTNVYASGDIIAFWTSDQRLKEDIKPLTSSLESIDRINGYTFKWKESEHTARTGEDIGLIAQEIQEVIPQAVIEKQDGYLGVDYTKVIPYLVSCIKELKQEIATLKNEIQ